MPTCICIPGQLSTLGYFVLLVFKDSVILLTKIKTFILKENVVFGANGMCVNPQKSDVG